MRNLIWKLLETCHKCRQMSWIGYMSHHVSVCPPSTDENFVPGNFWSSVSDVK